jgi:superfamily I DNA/RNA helicase/RecB family exonuclease
VIPAEPDLTPALDDSTRHVVEHDGGPLLVLGSPGTGKSAALVRRWLRLATEVVAPHRVLLLVGTRERALELRDALAWQLPGRALIEVPVHTWHALAYHLVSRYYRLLGYPEPPVVLTGAEQWAVVRDLLCTEKPDEWGPYSGQLTTPAFVDEVLDFCVRAGQRCAADIDLRQLGSDAIVDFGLRYRAELARTSRLDYAGLVAAAARLLEIAPDVRAAVAQRFPHVLVDDAQNLAPSQLRLLGLLATGQLVCAADPDCSIEAFRGGDPAWLASFEDRFPGARRIVLSTGYRTGAGPGAVAARLIGHDPSPGAHRASRFEGPPDATAEIRVFGTLSDEIEAAARAVREAHLLGGVPLDRIAVLLTQPALYAHLLRRSLEALGVPVRSPGDRPLAGEQAVRAVGDLCRVALDIDAGEDVVIGLLSSPLIGFDAQSLRALRRTAAKAEASLLDAARADGSPPANELDSLVNLVTAHRDEPANELFSRIFRASRWCREIVAARTRDADAGHQAGALFAFSRALDHFVERRRGGTIGEYLESSARAGFADSWSASDGAGVEVLSLFAAKGREWDLLLVLGVAEGQIPKAHRGHGLFDPWALGLGSPVERALAQLAEERRTLYVALTRARRRLIVSCSPGLRRASPSRFLEEAFGEIPSPSALGEGPPLSLAEAAGRLRRTLASAESSEDERAAAACALARMPGVDPSAWWWRRDFTPGAALYPGGELTTSYSRIGKYDDCPLRYVLESVLGLDPESTYQMKFGSLIHRIFEGADRGEITTLEQAKQIFKDEFVAHHKDDYPNVVFARTYWRAGLKMIDLWWRTERPRGETVAVEYSFDDLPLGSHRIRGRIDRIAKNGNGVVLSDYKTSASMAERDDVAKSLQLAIYYLAAITYPELTQHGEPSLMQLVYPGVKFTEWDTMEISCGRRVQRPEEARDALARLEGILAQAAAEVFDPAPTADCKFCDMKPLCPRHPEGREVPS